MSSAEISHATQQDTKADHVTMEATLWGENGIYVVDLAKAKAKDPKDSNYVRNRSW